MLEEDRPPREIWLDDDALEAHFNGLDQKRKDRAAGYESIPDLEQNELTKDLR